jgi:hypothetical protein
MLNGYLRVTERDVTGLSRRGDRYRLHELPVMKRRTEKSLARYRSSYVYLEARRLQNGCVADFAQPLARFEQKTQNQQKHQAARMVTMRLIDQ